MGDRVEVLYAARDPAGARIRSFDSLWVLPLTVSGVGTALLLFGFGATLSRKRAQGLRRSGTPVQTTLQYVEQNTSVSVNGRSPWQIVTQWADPSTGLLHSFRSKNVWFDPTPQLPGRITVYVDRRNPKRYFMDISFLSKLKATEAPARSTQFWGS